MKAIILAAGYGNRMRPLTNNTHKTLLKIGNETVISRIIKGLYNNGIENIIVGTGYKKDELVRYLSGTFPNIKFEFIDNPKYRETNNIYSLSLIFNSMEINDDILLIESDLIYESSVIKRIINSKYDNVALVDKFRSGMDGTVVTISDEKITNIIPPHLQSSSFDFSDKYKTLNIYKFSQEFCRSTFKELLVYYSNTIDNNCYYELILGLLIYMQRETINAEIIKDEKWAEIDDPNDLSLAEFIFVPETRIKKLFNNFGGYWNFDITDFSFIRNMYFPNSSIISELKNNMLNLIQNYGSKQSLLNTKLSYFLRCNTENVILLNGAAQIYPIIQEIYVNKKILIPNPTFGEYLRIFPKANFYNDKVGLNIKEIEPKLEKNEVIVFVNPNNPTGSIIDTNYIYDCAKRNPEKIFIVDESFIDFSRYQSIISILEVKPQDNIIVIKSLSTVLGIPGLRLGFVYTTNTEILKNINHSIPIWNINSISEFFLEIILKHRDSLKKSFNETIKDRERFINLLNKQDYIDTVYKSDANFILAKFKHEYNTLKGLSSIIIDKYSIYIRDVSDKFDDNKYYVRFAVRKPEENNHLIEVLNETFLKYINLENTL